MAQISLTLPSDGTTIEAADVNNPLNAILNEFNGNIDDNNIKSGANINGTKFLANSIAPALLDANGRAGWNTSILSAPNTITALGNRLYSLVFNTTDLTGYISAGMRLRTTRTTAAPTQCTSLNGTTQYYSKSSPSAMTFTDDFTVSAWIKLSAYGAEGSIVSRYNGTSGWSLYLETDGRLTLAGYNAGAANFSIIRSSQSIQLNKWVHVAAQLDMSAFTATTITSYVMIDGLDVPAVVSRGGTNPTALVQAGDLQIGANNGAVRPFSGKIAQVAVYNAKVTQATILASIHQTLSGSETALISAYSFNNTINDLNTTNANNLTANGSAVATNADSPYGGQADGTISSTLDYAEVLTSVFSTNTTLTVRLPDVNTIPTSGGISAVAYSTKFAPYGWPGISNVLGYITVLATSTITTPTTATAVPGLTMALTIPVGRKVKVSAYCFQLANSGAGGPANIGVCIGSVSDANRITQSNLAAAGTGGQFAYAETTYTPASTSVTFIAEVQASSGNVVVNSNVVAPTFLKVELI